MQVARGLTIADNQSGISAINFKPLVIIYSSLLKQFQKEIQVIEFDKRVGVIFRIKF